MVWLPFEDIYMSKSGGNLTIQYNLRWSEEMRDKIAASAKEHSRSMNSDIVHRLEQSFNLPNFITLKNELKEYPIDVLLVAIEEKATELGLDIIFRYGSNKEE